MSGVTGCRPTGGAADERSYDLTVKDGWVPAVQRAVMHFAAESDLIVTSNRQETLALEDVFLRIVNEERAA